MTCPFVADSCLPSCRASLDTYLPNQGEIREFCSDGKSEQYRLCGFYRRAVWSGLAAFLPKEQEQHCAMRREEMSAAAAQESTTS